MARVEIRCPSCQQKGYLEVSEEALKGVTRGLLAVNISDGTICEHTFIAYVDRNLNIRDYFIADFKIELPEIPPTEEIKEKRIPSKDVINLDLIKLNLPALLLTHVLKSIFSKQKVVILHDHEFLYNHIHNFFDYITADSFDDNIEIMNREAYKKNKKMYKGHMVFEGNQIINNVDNLIEDKKIKVEKQLIQTFLSETDLSYSYIMLKNEIHKAHKLATSILEYANEQQIEKLTLKIIVDNITETYNIKLHKTYLNFLIDIIISYFNVEVAETADVADFLGFI